MMIEATLPAHTPANAIRDTDSRTQPEKAPWPFLGRFGFRLAFCYLLLSVITVTGILNLLPILGEKMATGVDAFWTTQAQWVATHVLHVSGIAAYPHPTDSRDTLLDWITLGLIVLWSVAGTMVWSALDHRRREYQTAATWLRFILRLTLVFLMFRYGLMKVFPLQMSPPSLAVLTEPLGNTSPMTLLWTLIGLHPGYEILCGAIETLAAVLIFFRRTALLGGLLTVFVMTNVLLYNMFFDVPVKLGAANLLLYATAVVAPDLRPMYDFFLRRQPAVVNAAWAPETSNRTLRLCTRAFELAFIALVLFTFLPEMSHEAAMEHASVLHPSPLTGGWHVNPAPTTPDGDATGMPVLTGEGFPMTDIYLEPDSRVMARSTDGKLWRAQARVDMAKDTLALSSGYFDGVRFNATYRIAQPDAAHLVLTPLGESRATNGALYLTRLPMPASFPLLQRKFQWINEWALER